MIFAVAWENFNTLLDVTIFHNVIIDGLPVPPAERRAHSAVIWLARIVNAPSVPSEPSH